MKIRLDFGSEILTAMLDDNATSRDLIALLPLTLTLEDHGSTEKISMLPRKLSTQGAPPAYTPAAGDVTYYAPWGNLALFHRDFSSSSGLVRLGTIEASVEPLVRPGPLEVTIDLIDDQT